MSYRTADSRRSAKLKRMDITKCPSVVIDGNTFRLKVTLGGLGRLEEWGIDPNDLGSQPAPGAADQSNRRFRNVAGQLAAFAHVETAKGRLRPANLALQEVYDSLGLEDVKDVADALVAAWGNVGPTAPNPQAAPAETTTIA